MKNPKFGPCVSTKQGAQKLAFRHWNWIHIALKNFIDFHISKYPSLDTKLETLKHSQNGNLKFWALCINKKKGVVQETELLIPELASNALKTIY